MKRLNGKSKLPAKRNVLGKRFKTSQDKSAAESLFSLLSATPAVGKSANEVDVAQALVNFSTKAVVNTPTDVEDTVTDMMEGEEQKDKTESSTVTCDLQVSKIVYLEDRIKLYKRDTRLVELEAYLY